MDKFEKHKERRISEYKQRRRNYVRSNTGWSNYDKFIVNKMRNGPLEK